MRYLILLAVISLFSCCSSVNKLTYDKYREEKTMLLNEKVKTYPAEKRFFIRKKPFSKVNMQFFVSMAKSGNTSLSLNIDYNYRIKFDSPDSIIFMDIDNTIFSLTASTQTVKHYIQSEASLTTETSETSKTVNDEDDKPETTNVTTTANTSSYNVGTYEMIRQTFILPNEIILPMSNTRQFSCRVYFGNKAIDIEPTYGEKRRIRLFFTRVLQAQQ